MFGSRCRLAWSPSLCLPPLTSIVVQYRGLAPMYYRGASAAVIVYDITRRDTFEHVRSWVNELSTMGPAGVMLAIAGNKAGATTVGTVLASNT